MPFKLDVERSVSFEFCLLMVPIPTLKDGITIGEIDEDMLVAALGSAEGVLPPPIFVLGVSDVVVLESKAFETFSDNAISF